MKVLGVIPARGGSKGVKRKNIRIVAGEPLIAYSIKAAQESQLLTQFVVSTDNSEIKEVAERYGAHVIMRPPELAQDTSPVYEAVFHAVDMLENDEKFDAVVLLQPTSPLRTGENIDKAIEMLKNKEVGCVISVCLMDDVHPARMYEIGDKNFLIPLWPEFEKVRRQELPKIYYRNGAIYAIKTDVLRNERTFMCNRKRPLIMPIEWMVNIDNERDLLIADIMLKLWKEGKL